MKTSPCSPTLPSLLGCIALGLGAATTMHAEVPFQFGFFAPELQLADASESVRGLRIDFVYGENANVSGVDLGIVNSTTGDFAGFGWAPGANLVAGSATGVQWSSIYSRTGGEFTGWQSGIVAQTLGESTGLQTAVVGLSEVRHTGAQIGLVNRAASLKGLQLGLVNLADNLDGGLQIGLVNYAENSDVYKVLPIVNWQF